jgi:hypothetical protein
MDEDKSPKWCERCQKFHPWHPPFNLEDLIEKAAKEIADEIDAEVLAELLREAELPRERKKQ